MNFTASPKFTKLTLKLTKHGKLRQWSKGGRTVKENSVTVDYVRRSENLVLVSKIAKVATLSEARRGSAASAKCPVPTRDITGEAPWLVGSPGTVFFITAMRGF